MIETVIGFMLGGIMTGLAFCVGFNVGRTKRMEFPDERKIRLFSFRENN